MTPIPPEIKKWIEDEAENLPEKYGWENDGTAEPADIKRAAKDLATSLYQHLSGRVAELEKTIHDLQDDFNELVISSDKEVERLKGLLEKIIRTTRFYLPNLSSGEAWQQFKTENNL